MQCDLGELKEWLGYDFFSGGGAGNAYDIDDCVYSDALRTTDGNVHQVLRAGAPANPGVSS